MSKPLILSLVCVATVSCSAMENNQLVKEKKIGIYITQNNREHQEDRFYHGVVDGGNFYAVYDGHSGVEVADFLAKNLHTYFSQASGNDMRERIMTAFKNADNDECIKTHKQSGSTAAVVFIKNNKAHFAHVGDSRAVLDGETVFATTDHKPNRADEYFRIEHAKGLVFNKRVNGFLPISRAFGDYGLDKKLIISEPEYAEQLLTEENKFLILATDGLWDKVSNEEAIMKLKEVRANVQNMNDIAKLLASLAIKRGSKDNITVMLVDLL